MTLPAIPCSLPTLKGPVPVTCAPIDSGELAHGVTDFETRTIRVDERQTLLDQWHTLFHEAIHIVLYDHGITDLSEEQEESVCAAVSLWLAGQMVQSAPLLLPCPVPVSTDENRTLAYHSKSKLA